MFYTNLIAYSGIPDKKAIIDLQKRGFTIIINNKQNISEDIKALKGVTMVKLASEIKEH